MKDLIVQKVITKYSSRSEIGVTKYGTTLEGNNRDSYLNHLQQELMDATLYIEKLISLEQEMKLLATKYPNNQELGEAVRRLVS